VLAILNHGGGVGGIGEDEGDGGEAGGGVVGGNIHKILCLIR